VKKIYVLVKEILFVLFFFYTCVCDISEHVCTDGS